MKLILISSSGESDVEVQQVIQMFENGLQHFHIRKPKFSTNQLKKYIEEYPSKYHDRMIIHSHHLLARKFNLKGIHLSREHKATIAKTWLKLKWIQIKNPKLKVTTSFTTLAKLFETEANFDYVFLSPIFDSLTSKYQSGFTPATLKSSLAKSPFKVIARSGIELDKIEEVYSLGFDGAALYSSVWKKSDPVGSFTAFVKKCQELNIELT